MADDVERLAEALEAQRGKRRRVYLEDIWPVFDRLCPDAFRAEDNRARLLALLEAAAGRGLFELARRKERAGLVALPVFVRFPKPERPAPAPRPTVVWHPALVWADAIKLSDQRFGQLVAVNRWLRDGGETEPIVAEAERGYQLFRDEKAIAGLKQSSSIWGPFALNHRLLRCFPHELQWIPTGPGDRALVAENLATYQSLARALAAIDGHRYGGVIYGKGSFATSAEIGRLIPLPFAFTAADYFGDLDRRGLDIGATWCANMSRLGVAAGPHPILWAKLLEREPVADPHPAEPAAIDRLVAWLPEPLRERAAAILGAGRRIPQEAVGYMELSAEPRWARE